jgi:hypothetical protein
MCKQLWRLGVIVVAAAVLAGCKTNTSQVHDKPHPDPLFDCRKPLEGKPHDADAQAATRIDPQPPPVPGHDDAAIAHKPAMLGAPQVLQAP